MNNPTELTVHAITIDFEHAKATLQFLYQLVERLETDYYLARQNHQQQSLPGLPEPPPKRSAAVLNPPTKHRPGINAGVDPQVRRHQSNYVKTPTSNCVNTLTVLALTASAAAAFGMAVTPPDFVSIWSLALPVLMANFFITEPRLALLPSVPMAVSALLNAPESARESGVLAVVIAMAQLAVLSFLIACRTAYQQRELGLLAGRDPLTGVGNRRALQAELQARAMAHRTCGEPCGLALLDLDIFKAINDRFGHEVGDHLLTEAVDFAENILRGGDRIYRFGGDEFAIILPATSRAGVGAALGKLQREFERKCRQPDRCITVSIGGPVWRLTSMSTTGFAVPIARCTAPRPRDGTGSQSTAWPNQRPAR